MSFSWADGAEVILDITVTRRQAAVTDIKRMIRPTTATVPVRLTLDQSDMSVEQLLR